MYVDPVGFDDLPEGVARPGFFRGVATVVTKLFNIVQPDFVYFGQKDALQCVLINRLVEVLRTTSAVPISPIDDLVSVNRAVNDSINT